MMFFMLIFLMGVFDAGLQVLKLNHSGIGTSRPCIVIHYSCIIRHICQCSGMSETSSHILVLLHRITGQDRETLRGILGYAAARPGWILHHHLPVPGFGDPLSVLLKRLRPAGILLEGWRFTDAELSLARKAGVPVVAVMGPIRPGCSWVKEDPKAAARAALEHFREEGLRHVAYVSHANDCFAEKEERHAAFLELAREEGMDCHSYPSAPSRNRRVEETRLRRFLRELPKPCGVICFTASVAVVVLEHCDALDIGVPSELAVMATAANQLECRMTQSPLTTLDLDDRRIGREAAALLDRQIKNGQARDELVTIPPAGVVADRSTDISATRDPSLGRALEIMRTGLAEPLRAPEVARAAGMSVRKMQNLFARIRGRSFGEELRRLRREHALRLLRETRLSVEAIAEASGFSHASHLNRILKEDLGKTPGEVRMAAL